MENYFITNDGSQDLFGFYPKTILELVKALEGEKLLSVDTETQSLSPFRDGNQLLMIQISTPTANYVVDCQTVEISPLKEIFASKEVIKIMHNGKFDCLWLKYFGLPVENVYCTFLVEKVIHCGKDFIKYGLKDVLKRYEGIEMDKEQQSSFIGHSGSFSKEQVLYGIDDTRHLFSIREKQLLEVERLELENVVKLENEVLLTFVDLEFSGMNLDKPSWEDLAETAKIKIDEIHPQMDDLLVSGFPEFKTSQTTMFEARKTEVNWASPKQVLEIFQKIDPTLKSVGAPVIKNQRHPMVVLYKRYKELMKLYGSYGLTWYKYLDDDGRARTNISQILETGRISSSNPNLQQISGDYRNAFVPSEGKVFVSADYSSMELVVLGYFAKEESWLKIMREGGDLHSSNASLVFKDAWTNATDEEKKAKRTLIKIVAFSLVYGAGYQSLAANMNISEDEAKKTIEEFFRTFPKITSFLDALKQYGKSTGIIRTARPFRRLRTFSAWRGVLTDRSEMGSIKRKSTNTFVQGTSADLCKQALILLRNEINSNNYDIKVVNVIHDEILVETTPSFSDEAEKILQKAMEDAANVILEPGLLRAEPQTSLRWEK